MNHDEILEGLKALLGNQTMTLTHFQKLLNATLKELQDQKEYIAELKDIQTWS